MQFPSQALVDAVNKRNVVQVHGPWPAVISKATTLTLRPADRLIGSPCIRYRSPDPGNKLQGSVSAVKRNLLDGLIAERFQAALQAQPVAY